MAKTVRFSYMPGALAWGVIQERQETVTKGSKNRGFELQQRSPVDECVELRSADKIVL